MVAFILVCIILVAIIIGGIWIADRAARLEEGRKKQIATSRHLRNHAIDIEDLIKNLVFYEDNLDLFRILTSYLISENEKRYALDPDNSESLEDLNRSKELLDSFSQETVDKREIIDPKSDNEVASMRRYLAKTIRVLKHLKIHESINETVYLGHTNRLKLKALNAEVNAYIKQGDSCMGKKDKLAAANYYKHAKEILSASEFQFDGKSTEIKRISKLISNIYATDVKKQPIEMEEDHSASLD